MKANHQREEPYYLSDKTHKIENNLVTSSKVKMIFGIPLFFPPWKMENKVIRLKTFLPISY